MKVLFIGGTGRLSKDVANLAVKQGWETYLLTRGSKERQQFVNLKYTMLYGDIRNHEQCKKTIQNFKFDVIIDFLTFNVDELKVTLDVIEGKYKQYIFISTATVYEKKSEDEVISEDSTIIGNTRWNYAKDKYECEKYLKTYFVDKDASYTVVRPYVTYGNTRVPYPIVPTDTQREWTFIDRILHKKPIPVFDQGNTLTTLTHTKDFAVGVVGLFLNQKAYGQAFHITGDQRTTWGIVLTVLEKNLNKSINRCQLSQKDIYSSIPYYKEILIGDKGTNMVFDNNKIKTYVPEFKTNILLEVGIKDMIEFYQNHPESQRIDWKWNGQIDRLCKEPLSKIKEYGNMCLKDKIKYMCGYYPLIGKFVNLKTRIINKL